MTEIATEQQISEAPEVVEPPVVIVEQQDDDTFCGVKIPRWR
jgi:hypothetical protein